MTVEAIQERIARLAAEAPAKRERERAENRAAMPGVGEFVDEYAIFGKSPYGHFAGNGRTITWGKPDRDDRPRPLPETKPIAQTKETK